MKKFLALLLALVMVFALAACGGTDSTPSDAPESEAPASEAPADDTPASEAPADDGVITDPNEIPNDAESADGTYEVAFVTDVGQLQDGSFNEGTWNGVKLYAANNGLTYKYYQPANGNEATDDDRVNAMQAAVDAGAKVVVCAGFLQEAALRTAAMNNPDVHFVFIDGYPLDDDPDPNVQGNILTNVAGINFQEEQCGYLAGYAIVKEGFTKIGFSGGGGGSNPACCRYGYGYVQGADAAAKELGTNIDINYFYGGQFYGDANITSRMEGWYADGTQVVFACGGGIWTSALDAAETHDGKVIGVDVDQRSKIGERCLTSAMKGLPSAINNALDSYFSGNFSELGGTAQQLGLKDGDYIGLPTDSESWGFTTFTQDQYETVLAGIRDGSIEISSDTENQPEVGSHVTVDYIS